MIFSFPAHLDHSVVSELENYIINICNSCPTLENITASSAPVWDWASQILQQNPAELHHEIEIHESGEHFADPYLAEKDDLLKLPLLLLEKINYSKI
jgi:hypothetical protein